jgi:hypothetical protein
MKNFLLSSSLLLIIMFLNGCVVNLQDTISGNGEVVAEKRDVAEFTGLKVETGIDVYISQGDVQQVEVEADENLHEWIRTEINGSILHIYSEKTIRSAKTKKVNLTCKMLDKIDISSAGDVTGLNRFKINNLEIDMSSAGDLKIDVDADVIDLSLSSAGDAELSGTANVLKADLSSAGDLDAFDLEAKQGDITVSSASNARVFITEQASFRSSSAGNIQYRGEPRIKEINTSSAGSVNKK